MNEKDRRLADFCRQGGFEGVWLRRRSNVAWATDGADVHVDASSSRGVASVLWTPQRKRILTNNIEAARLAAEEPLAGWEIEADPWWEPAVAPQGKYATDYPDDTVAELRSPLTSGEIERLRRLGAQSAATMDRIMKTVQRGWSERDVAAELACELLKDGIQCPVLLVAADERVSLFRHPVPTARRIEKLLMAVICAQRSGLIVAMTRLVHFGPLPGDLRRKHDAVCRVDEALHAATQPDAAWCDILAEGIRVYRETGYADEWQKHHQGGPMGYEPRDFVVTPDETRRVVVNQAVAWNPSITGTKSEDTLLSTGEVLTVTSDWPMNGTRPDILVRPPGIA